MRAWRECMYEDAPGHARAEWRMQCERQLRGLDLGSVRRPSCIVFSYSLPALARAYSVMTAEVTEPMRSQGVALHCPSCQTALSVEDSVLVCPGCGTSYPIRGG